MDGTQVVEFSSAVCGSDAADGAGQAAYDEAFGCDVITLIAHAFQQLTVCNSCGGKEHILR